VITHAGQLADGCQQPVTITKTDGVDAAMMA
jgi:hypothetical protein